MRAASWFTYLVRAGLPWCRSRLFHFLLVHHDVIGTIGVDYNPWTIRGNQSSLGAQRVVNERVVTCAVRDQDVWIDASRGATVVCKHVFGEVVVVRAVKYQSLLPVPLKRVLGKRTLCGAA